MSLNEIWVQIDGCNGYYISNLGRVKADEVKTRFGKQYKTYPERFIKTYPTPTGYQYLKISINGKLTTLILHRLVALYFVSNPKSKLQVNHIDGDKDNNHFLNLEWMTASENLKHARDLGLNNSIGYNNKMAKFSESQIIDIRKSKDTVTKIAEHYNVSLAIISRIRSLKSYKNVG